MEISGRLLEVISIELGVDANKIAPESGPDSIDIDEWDSFAHVILILAIEEAFDIKFSLEEIPRLDSVKKLQARILEKTELPNE